MESTESKPVIMLAVVTGELCCPSFTNWWWYKLNPKASEESVTNVSMKKG